MCDGGVGGGGGSLQCVCARARLARRTIGYLCWACSPGARRTTTRDALKERRACANVVRQSVYVHPVLVGCGSLHCVRTLLAFARFDG